MKKDTQVKCDVESCKHNDSNYCALKNLDISCTCNGCECHNKNETICHSFKEKEL